MEYTGHTYCCKCGRTHWMHGQCDRRIRLPHRKERLVRLMAKQDGMNPFFVSDRERLTMAELSMKNETLKWQVLCVSASLRDLGKALKIKKLIRYLIRK